MKVLVADDSLVSRRMLEVALTNEGYQVVLASDGAEALRILNGEECPRLVILDWIMPHIDGLQVCQLVRRKGDKPYIYLILVTAQGEQEEIIRGLEAGADDYMTKPIDLSELKARLRSGRRILDLEEQLVSALELLRIQATHDSLTGLLNRGAILEVLEKELSRGARQRLPLSVIAVDLDHFKLINDTYGHQAGDAVLRETAQKMKSSLRKYDAIGRYGGEEFLIVSPGTDTSSSVEQAERIRRRVLEGTVDFSGSPIPVTVSLGVASTDGRPWQAEHLIRSADEALYAAKRNGRNRVETRSLIAQ